MPAREGLDLAVSGHFRKTILGGSIEGRFSDRWPLLASGSPPLGLTQLPGQDNPVGACSLPAAPTTTAHLPQGLQLGFLLAFLDSGLVLAFLDSELVLAFLDWELVLVFLDLGQVQVRGLLGPGQKLPSELRGGRPPLPSSTSPAASLRGS